jgi:hypothetical protein
MELSIRKAHVVKVSETATMDDTDSRGSKLQARCQNEEIH